MNLESLRHRLNNVKDCLVQRVSSDSANSVTAGTYEAAKENIVQTVNTGKFGISLLGY